VKIAGFPRGAGPWATAAVLVLSLILAIEAAAGILQSPTLSWNEVRLGRSMGLLYGFPLYVGEHAPGPVIGTLHTPVSHVIYILAALVHDPTLAIVAGSFLSFLLTFIPMGWVLARAKESVSGTALAFLFCGFLILGTPGMHYSALMIHTDAPALAFGSIACGIFANSRQEITRRQLWISGIACALVIGCKQTLAPMAVGIAIFLWIAGGRRQAMQFLLALVSAGALLLAAILLFVPPDVFFFNTVTLTLHRPLKGHYFREMVRYFQMAKQDALPALVPLAFFAVFPWVDPAQRGVRQFFQANRWMIFALAALSLVPLAAKAMITNGADVNHLGIVLYFLFLAAGLAIQKNLAGGKSPVLHLAALIFAALGILVALAPGALISLIVGSGHLRENATEAAYHYEIRHPGRAYFPWNPVASLLATGKMYHAEYAIYDREIAGHPLTPAQYAAGIPARFELVAIPPGENAWSEALVALLARCQRGTDPELPGWVVYKRTP
jgi:hypothetical protein